MRLIDADALADNIAVFFERNENLIDEYVTSTIEDEIETAPTVDAEPTILSVGVVKEYDNGMVAMRKETYQEYHAIAVNEAVRRLDIEVLSEIERSTST